MNRNKKRKKNCEVFQKVYFFLTNSDSRIATFGLRSDRERGIMRKRCIGVLMCPEGHPVRPTWREAELVGQACGLHLCRDIILCRIDCAVVLTYTRGGERIRRLSCSGASQPRAFTTSPPLSFATTIRQRVDWDRATPAFQPYWSYKN